MRAYRSPIRLFAFGLFGIILMLASVDVMFGHWISEEPENTDGVLGTRGLAQQRGDIVWGAAMVAVGTLLVGTSVIELVRRRPQVAVGSEGIMVAIGSNDADVVLLWRVVDAVGSDTMIDPYDGSVREVLVLSVNDRSGLPDEPIGAVWSGDTLLVDAHDWTRSVTDVALAAQGALGHHRRVAETREMGPPSVVWETEADEGTRVIEEEGDREVVVGIITVDGPDEFGDSTPTDHAPTDHTPSEGAPSDDAHASTPSESSHTEEEELT